MSGLATDLYELTMMQAYAEEGMDGIGVFEVFVRKAPAARNFLLACGIDDCLDKLASVRFSEDDIEYLRGLGRFSDAFLEGLCLFRFEGDVRAMPEGTPFFGGEPILEVAAPIPQAQLVEALVLNAIALPTIVASKTARLVAAARGRSVVDFGFRRAHGMDAGLHAARAAFVAGADATSNVLAGREFGIPVVGTMAHSYVQAHESEAASFEAFGKVFPGTTLLVDTYDTQAGVDEVIRLARTGAIQVGGIRLDSGDLGALAHSARRALNEAGLRHVRIFASGNLDEDRIDALIRAKAPIDAFGVGTQLVAPSDAPNLDCVYKLAEYDGRPTLKLSKGKATLPGRKQVFRLPEEDVVGLVGESLPGRPLLVDLMRRGRSLAAGSVHDARARAASEIAALPARLRGIAPATYPVRLSEKLQRLRDDTAKRVARRQFAATM